MKKKRIPLIEISLLAVGIQNSRTYKNTGMFLVRIPVSTNHDLIFTQNFKEDHINSPYDSINYT